VHLGDIDAHHYAEAWRGPLLRARLQLLFFGSGWVRPDLGLARWLGLGKPDDDPVLKIVNRWWGSRIAEILAWSSWSHTLARTHTTIQHVPLPDRWADARRSSDWENTWGCGGDCMHLSTHAVTPVRGEPKGAELMVSASRIGGALRAALSLPS
jgi:hypothetical protein